MSGEDIRNVGISVLGPLTLDDSAPHLSPRETLVLAALTAAGDEALSADQLSEVVWGDTPPVSWHKNFQSCVVRLRKVLGPDAIATSGTGYRLTVPVDAVDARQFEALATRGHELLELGEPDRAAYALIYGFVYVDGGRSLLVSGSDKRTVIVDSETLQPRRRPP